MPDLIRAVVVVLIALAASPAGRGLEEKASPPTSCRETPLVRETPPRDPAADPFGPGPWYVNADRTLWAGHGEPLLAGKRGNKVLWIRPRGVRLEIHGRRLDHSSRPLRVEVPGNYPYTFQPTGLYFPASGCWEITARASRTSLTFITKSDPAPDGTASFPRSRRGRGSRCDRSDMCLPS
jgi:hypothetical protein